MRFLLVERALIVNVVCNMIENVVMIVGIVYSAVIFKRFSLLWFLLLPVANSITVKFNRGNEENGGDTEENQ